MANYKMEVNLNSLTWHKKNRGQFEIIASMLEAMRDDRASRYSIIKHVGSNFAEINKYLESLTKLGFIKMDIKEDRVLYRASEKGLAFLKQYYVLLTMLLSTSACENMVLNCVKIRES